MKTNQAGVDLIKKWEGFRGKAYLCPARVWTIGYGHTSAAGKPQVKSGMRVTRAEAETILKRDLGKYERAVRKGIGPDAAGRATANQFAAMVSLCYNIGGEAFKRSSVARHFRNGDADRAAASFRMWSKGGGKVLRGLVNRRAEETRLFKTKDGKRVAPPPTEVATGVGAAGGGAAVATKAVYDGLISPEVAIFGGVLFAAFIGAVIFFRRKKT